MSFFVYVVHLISSSVLYHVFIPKPSSGILFYFRSLQILPYISLLISLLTLHIYRNMLWGEEDDLASFGRLVYYDLTGFYSVDLYIVLGLQ